MKSHARRLTSRYKVALHRRQLDQYVAEGWTFPVTLELDLTTRCNRRCPGCATTTRPAMMDLDSLFVENLLRSLAGETRGLLLAGGEPTIAPAFVDALRAARRAGLREIAVVTNGARLADTSVAEALVSHATVARVSIGHSRAEAYARAFGCSPDELHRVLANISRLRDLIEKRSSELEIGVSALTRAESLEELPAIADQARSAGAHWVYFHPCCGGWDQGAPYVLDQRGVSDAIRGVLSQADSEFSVYCFFDRYERTDVEFDGYHAAHFLLVVGADGICYLSPETKYVPQYAIGRVEPGRNPQFGGLGEWSASIASWQDMAFAPVAARSRGALYSHLIDQVLRGKVTVDEVHDVACRQLLGYPYIL